MGNSNRCICGLGPVCFGVGLGVASALFMLVVAWAGWLGGYGTSIIDQWTNTYPGFAATFFGGVVGAVWGFVQGFIFGLITAIFYNMCLRCCSKGCGDKGSCCDTQTKM